MAGIGRTKRDSKSGVLDQILKNYVSRRLGLLSGAQYGRESVRSDQERSKAAAAVR